MKPTEKPETTEGRMRLAKYLSLCGVESRRKAEELIEQGLITLNGNIVQEQGVVIDPAVDVVLHDGERVCLPSSHETWVLNKPRRVIVSKTDPQGRQTVYDILPPELEGERDRLRYVGRLDFMSEGLLIATTDGELAHQLMHPKFQVEKEYVVTLQTALEEGEIEQLKKGIVCEGELLAIKKVEPLRQPKFSLFPYSFTLNEGKNRHIRRLIDALDKKLVRLKRIRTGSLHLNELESGQWRKLTAKELQELQKPQGTSTKEVKVLPAHFRRNS